MSQVNAMNAPRLFAAPRGGTIAFTPLGFGSAPLGNYRRILSEEECDATVRAAWDGGLRYFDTAPFYGYGLAEARLGRLLRHKPRDSFTLATKVGRILEPCAPEDTDNGLYLGTPDIAPRYDYSYDGVMRSFASSRQRMGIDRFDILYVHDIDALVHGGRDKAVERTRELFDQGGWRALDELRAAGDVKAIGIGVNEWEPCALMLELADPDIFLLAGRYTLIEHAPLTALFPQCAKRGVGVVIGGPYNSGVLAGGSTYNYGDVPAEIASAVARVDRVCRDHGVSMPAAALQFVLAHPVVVTVIPGSQSVAEVESNIGYMTEEIPGAFWDDLRSSAIIPPEAPTPQ